jgi:TolB-like protein
VAHAGLGLQENMGDQFKLRLLGPFGLFRADGSRIAVSSRKSAAILAMLATAPNGLRSRGWLRTMLWGERGEAQASASLRKELSNLCTALEEQQAGQLIEREMQRIRLRLSLLDVDIFSENLGRTHPAQAVGEFLEGLDIPGAEAFEEWLREERMRMQDVAAALGALGGVEPPSPSDSFGGPVAILNVDAPGQLSLPPKPSIAVLPFDQVSGSAPNGAWLGEALADELGMLLSQYPQIFVISSASARRMAQSATDLQVLAQAFGVRYLIEGTVGLFGLTDLIRVSIKLVDARTGEQVWGRSVQTSRDQLPTIEAEIASQVAPMIWSRIDASERNRVLRSVGPPINNYEAYWQASGLLRTWEPDAVAEATRLLDGLLRSTPACPWANGLASFCCALGHFLPVGEDPDTLLRRSVQYRQTALARGEDNVEALGYCAGAILLSNGDVNLADRLIAHALTMMPLFQPSLFWGGWVDLVSGELGRAEERFKLAMRLNPATGVRGETLCGIGFCALFRGEFGRALEAFLGAEAEAANFPPLKAGLALARAFIGATGPSQPSEPIPPASLRFLTLIRQPELRAWAERAIAPG